MSQINDPKQIKTAPFPLQEQEIILLQGGLGAFVRIWTFFALPILFCVLCYMPLGLIGVWLHPAEGGDPPWLTTLTSILCMLPFLLFGFGPWLFSGRYWLTTRQVIWQPRLGRRKHLLLSEIKVDKIRYFSWTQSLQLRGERSVILRLVNGLAQLWGGILLLQTPGLAAAIEDGSTKSVSPDVVFAQSATCSSLSGRTGVAILTRTYVAFLPAQLDDYSVEVFVDAIFSIISAHPKAIHPELPLEVALTRLAGLSPELFLSHLQRLIAQYKGVYWRNGMATAVERQAIPISNSQALNFKTGKITLRFTVSPEQVPFVERLLIAWAFQDN